MSFSLTFSFSLARARALSVFLSSLAPSLACALFLSFPLFSSLFSSVSFSSLDLHCEHHRHSVSGARQREVRDCTRTLLNLSAAPSKCAKHRTGDDLFRGPCVRRCTGDDSMDERKPKHDLKGVTRSGDVSVMVYYCTGFKGKNGKEFRTHTVCNLFSLIASRALRSFWVCLLPPQCP